MKFSEIIESHHPFTPEQHKRIWETADFCLDTNVLLNVYRYSPEKREEFLALLQRIKDRLFVPYTVAAEFARNRKIVIREQFAPQEEVKSTLEKLKKRIESGFARHAEKDNLHNMIEGMVKVVDEKYEIEKSAHLDLVHDDKILLALSEILDERVGEKLDTSSVEKEYNQRKKDSRPPYCETDDKKDSFRKMGDVTIWLELLNKYKESSKPVIFVTGDQKQNWWQKTEGHSEPQHSLIQEMTEKSKAGCLFYRDDRFIHAATKYLGVEPSPGLVQETKDIRRRIRENRKRKKKSEYYTPIEISRIVDRLNHYLRKQVDISKEYKLLTVQSSNMTQEAFEEAGRPLLDELTELNLEVTLLKARLESEGWTIDTSEPGNVMIHKQATLFDEE
ncbi:PIN domain-containing protein [Thalassoroseus pseudoceratinae]|uniref:PIN domain-containing protein n=1 Tax=Thalassoroseus pseudoceratinae TaxID=2713176 RepID=UPI001421837F|nr:PIN domain-containing protein [Thalassoroseus pseudoceratinae]